MTAPIERPDWGEGTALVPAEVGGETMPAETTEAFADPHVEQRYRAMVANRMTKASLPVDEARGALDAKLIDEWGRSGGVAARLAQAQKSAIAILDRFSPDERKTFIGIFDALPESVRSAVFSEISLGSVGSVRSASDADVSRFAVTPEGAALAKEWGHRANRNLAVIRDRVSRIIGRLAAEDIATATQWFDDLPPASAALIYRMLIGR